MILEIRAENFLAFSNEIVFSLESDMRNKRLSSNVHRKEKFNILKTAGIYGQNNVGKTCLIKAIKAIKSVMLNESIKLQSNYFTTLPVCSLGITFLYEGKKYSYDFKYNVIKKEYVYENFSEIKKDDSGNETKKNYLLRDKENNKYYYNNNEIRKMLPLISQNNILIYLFDTESFNELKVIKEIFIGFASKIDIVSMTNIPIRRTIELLKNKDMLQEKVVNFIKNADLDLEDFLYNDNSNIQVDVDHHTDNQPDESVLNLPDRIVDQIRLTSVYKGIRVPSLLFDSTGTKKIVALASYIVEALEYGRILVIDELDSSIHFKLTRAIVAMFNNELNTNAQMIFTVHDINLMDCKKLFRKEQVWFLNKDNKGVYLYSLSDFTAQDGVRDTTDIIEKYRKGLLGALPEPTLINTLLQLHDKRDGKSNE